MNEHDIFEVEKENYSISTDQAKLDLQVIANFLHHDSYWANSRPIERIAKTIRNSLCFGIYTETGEQVGFARIVTDYGTFAYLADVFILNEHQQKGLGKWLVETIIECPNLAEVSRFTLYTRDAHGLYVQYGFTRLEEPERFNKYMDFNR